MEKYFAYWKRGWWVLCMSLCMNVGIALVIIPLGLLFRDNLTMYYIMAAAVTMLFSLPFSAWIFEQFAHRSRRLIGEVVD